MHFDKLESKAIPKRSENALAIVNHDIKDVLILCFCSISPTFIQGKTKVGKIPVERTSQEYSAHLSA